MIDHTFAGAIGTSTKRNVDLNRFEVVVDPNNDSVEICDVLEVDMSERVSLGQFRVAVRDALSRLG